MPRKALTDDERAQRRQADRDSAREAVDALKATDGWQRWLSSRRHFHRYSLANQLLIAHQCPHATRVAGFRAWLKLGYCVAQGQSAIRIWVPMAPSKAQLQRWRAAGSDPDDRPRTHFRLGPVFDRNQVQELPPPAQPVGLDPPIATVDGDTLTHLNQPLRRLAADLGSLVELETMSAHQHGYYEPQSKRIALNDTLSVNAQVKTLIHELAHALVRTDRLDEDPQLSYAEEELVAESVVFWRRASIDGSGAGRCVGDGCHRRRCVRTPGQRGRLPGWWHAFGVRPGSPMARAGRARATEATMSGKRRLSEAEREQRRARDREAMKAAAEALLTSEGWHRSGTRGARGRGDRPTWWQPAKTPAAPCRAVRG